MAQRAPQGAFCNDAPQNGGAHNKTLCCVGRPLPAAQAHVTHPKARKHPCLLLTSHADLILSDARRAGPAAGHKPNS